MTERIKLTPGRIDKATCPDGKQQVILRDSEQPGLGLRITVGGAKSYVFQGKLAGQVVRMTLGDVETLALSVARDRAGELRTIIRSGRDPRQVKAELTAADQAKRQQAKADKLSALDAWSYYMKARASRWSARTLLDHQRLVAAGGEPRQRGKGHTLPGSLFSLLNRPLAEIDVRAVAEWLESNGSRPAVAQFGFARLRAFLNWCAEHPGFKQAQPQSCQSRSVTDLVPQTKARSDCLERQHLGVWFEHIRRLPPVQAAYLQVTLLSGARRNDLAPLRWSDVDFKWNTLRLGGKSGERTIPLTPHIRRLLIGLRDTPSTVCNIMGGTFPAVGPWVFPSATAKAGYIAEPRSGHDRALKQAGLPHVSIHGLRRSFGSLAQWCDLPFGVIEQIQGHAPQGTAEKHYRVRPIDLLAKWHGEYEHWILEQAGIQVPQVNIERVA